MPWGTSTKKEKTLREGGGGKWTKCTQSKRMFSIWSVALTSSRSFLKVLWVLGKCCTVESKLSSYHIQRERTLRSEKTYFILFLLWCEFEITKHSSGSQSFAKPFWCGHRLLDREGSGQAVGNASVQGLILFDFAFISRTQTIRNKTKWSCYWMTQQTWLLESGFWRLSEALVSGGGGGGWDLGFTH